MVAIFGETSLHVEARTNREERWGRLLGERHVGGEMYEQYFAALIV